MGFGIILACVWAVRSSHNSTANCELSEINEVPTSASRALPMKLSCPRAPARTARRASRRSTHVLDEPAGTYQNDIWGACETRRRHFARAPGPPSRASGSSWRRRNRHRSARCGRKSASAPEQSGQAARRTWGVKIPHPPTHSQAACPPLSRSAPPAPTNLTLAGAREQLLTLARGGPAPENPGLAAM